MMNSTFKGRAQLRRFEVGLKRAGLEDHLRFARALAAKGTAPDEIAMLMRGNFSKEIIEALLAEARFNTTRA